MRKLIFAGFISIFLLVVICTSGCVSNVSVFGDPIVDTWDVIHRASSNYATYYRYVFNSDGTGAEYHYDEGSSKNDDGVEVFNPNSLREKYDLTWKFNGTDKNDDTRYYIISYNGYSSQFNEEFELRTHHNSNGENKYLEFGAHDLIFIPSKAGDIIDPGNTMISANNGKIEEEILGTWYQYIKSGWNAGDVKVFIFEADGTGEIGLYLMKNAYRQTSTYHQTSKSMRWHFDNLRGEGSLSYKKEGDIWFSTSYSFKLENSTLFINDYQCYRTI